MIKQTAGRDNLGELVPKFVQLNDDEYDKCSKNQL